MGSGGSVNSEKNRQNYTIQDTRNVGKSISRETIVVCKQTYILFKIQIIEYF